MMSETKLFDWYDKNDSVSLFSILFFLLNAKDLIFYGEIYNVILSI